MAPDRDTDGDGDIPSYNNNPILLRGHLDALWPALAKKNANYTTLLKCGYMVSGRITIC